MCGGGGEEEEEALWELALGADDPVPCCRDHQAAEHDLGRVVHEQRQRNQRELRVILEDDLEHGHPERQRLVGAAEGDTDHVLERSRDRRDRRDREIERSGWAAREEGGSAGEYQACM